MHASVAAGVAVAHQLPDNTLTTVARVGLVPAMDLTLVVSRAPDSIVSKTNPDYLEDRLPNNRMERPRTGGRHLPAEAEPKKDRFEQTRTKGLAKQDDA